METEGDDSRLRFDHAIVPQLERWVRRILGAGYTTDLSNFESDEEREQWVMEELGIVDRTLASALVKSMNESGTAEEAARRVWEGIRPWPGSLWARRGVNK
jgi:hypothetical protein